MYKELTFRENKEKADELLRYFQLEDESIPIDPELLARKMGIQVVPYDNLYRWFHIKGFVVKYGTRLLIYIDEYHYMNQTVSSLFTIGEEIGHVVLHLEEVDEIKTPEEWIKKLVETDEYHAYVEGQARLFSSNLILPHEKFRPFCFDWTMKNLKDLKRFGNYTHSDIAFNIAMLMSDDLSVSQSILKITLERYPIQIIKEVVSEFPELMNG